MSTYPLGERDRAFADNLDRLRGSVDGRQALAILRRGAARGTARFDAIRVLDRVIPHGSSDRDFDTYGMVSALYAVYHQGRLAMDTTDGDLGDSFARLGRRPGWETERAARRLTLLLAASSATLDERLRRAVTLLRSAAVPIDWGLLARDVRSWGWDGQPVQRRWARSFVADRAGEADAVESTTNQQGEEQ